ncbi:MAG: ABC transporter permease [Anaerolineae bacterium]
MPGPLRRWAAISLKEYKHVWFDPSFLFLTIFSPAVLLTLLAYVFSFNVDQAKIALVDQDHTTQSFEYVRALTADGDLEIVATAGSYEEVLALFRTGKADTALIIPPGFGSSLAARRTASVNLLVDGSDPSIARQVISQIEQRTTAYNASLVNLPPASFDVRTRIWFNPNLDSQYSMVPGLMAIVLILPALAAALGITREKETGTFETLVTTPVRGAEFLLGKMGVYLSLGLVGALLALGVAVFWFRVPFRGSLAFYLLMTGVYLYALMGFALLVSQFIASQRTATTIVLLAFFIPSFFLTDLILPVEREARASLLASLALPSSHFITISRGIALKGIGLGDLLPQALILLAMGTIATLGSILLFSKRIA